jgi:hypothetical protein
MVGDMARGCPGGLGGLACLVLLPFVGIVGGVVVGSVAGAVTAEAAEHVKKAEAELQNAVTTLRVQETVRDRVFQVTGPHTLHPIIFMREQDPTALEQEVYYRVLASKGMDTILEINVLTLALAGRWEINPPLAVFMRVHTRLIRTVDATVLYDSTLEYHGATRRKFTEWALYNAQPFREELDHASESLAEKIVEEVFLVYYLPHERQQISQRDAPYKSSG